MSERLKIMEKIKKPVMNQLRRPRAAAGALLASIALAGCGNTMYANDWSLTECGTHDYSRAGKPIGKQSVSQIVASAQTNVLTLQKRALRSGGSIDLPRYSADGETSQDTIEINASKDRLTLSFDRSGEFASPRVDHVNFPIGDNSTHINQGAVVCFEGDESQLATTGTYDSLQQYVQQTAPLDR